MLSAYPLFLAFSEDNPVIDLSAGTHLNALGFILTIEGLSQTYSSPPSAWTAFENTLGTLMTRIKSLQITLNLRGLLLNCIEKMKSATRWEAIENGICGLHHLQQVVVVLENSVFDDGYDDVGGYMVEARELVELGLPKSHSAGLLHIREQKPLDSAWRPS